MEQFAQNIKDLEVTTVDRGSSSDLLTKRQQLSSSVAKLALTVVNSAATLAGVVADTKAHIFFINSERSQRIRRNCEPSALNTAFRRFLVCSCSRWPSICSL